MFNEDFWKQFEDVVEKVVRNVLSEKSEVSALKEWLTQSEVCAEYSVSRGTLLKLRKNNELEFSYDFAGHIIYPQKGIEKYFERRTVYAAGDPVGKLLKFKKEKAA